MTVEVEVAFLGAEDGETLTLGEAGDEAVDAGLDRVLVVGTGEELAEESVELATLGGTAGPGLLVKTPLPGVLEVSVDCGVEFR